MWSRFKTFSVREGIEPLAGIQTDDLDDRTRNQLWNLFSWLLDKLSYDRAIYNDIWTQFFGESVSSIPRVRNYYNLDKTDAYCNHLHDFIVGGDQEGGFVKGQWNQVFDLLEYLLYWVDHHCHEPETKAFPALVNNVFSEEMVGYRLVGKSVTSITDDSEVQSISEAVDTGCVGVRKHLEKANALLSDRETPDYPNSIKESISAVESLLKKVTGESNMPLGRALNRIADKNLLPISPLFKSGLEKMYAYTNDAEGVRHAVKNGESAEGFAEAKYMLVICTAFINYLVDQCASQGLDIT